MKFEKFKVPLIYFGLLASGIVIGLCIPLKQIRVLVAEILELNNRPVEETPVADKLSVEVTESSAKSLGLDVDRAELKEYTPDFEIPALIRELPGASGMSIGTRFEGLVTKVFAGVGQAVRAGDPVYEIELTGEGILRSQSSLLLAAKKVENIQTEMDRLQELIQQGGVARKRHRELSYEKSQFLAEIDTLSQELLLHGLNQEQVASIRNSGELIQNVLIRVPENLIPPQLNSRSLFPKNFQPVFILEELHAKPGTVVESGKSLCELAFHEVLVVEGHAFEKDLPRLRELQGSNQRLKVSVGTDRKQVVVARSQLAFISNHADLKRNTYPFYIYLINKRNEVSVQEQADEGHVSWKWKPGQRAHISIPLDSYSNKIVVPKEAVAENGLTNIVFEWKGQVAHQHDEMEEAHEHADEYVPVTVKVVYRDNRMVVIDPNGDLKPGTRIAFNNANMLLFAMQSGSGGGHHHGHEH